MPSVSLPVAAGVATDAAADAALGTAAAATATAGTAAASTGVLGTLASVAPYASLISGGIGAVGALESGAATANAAKYQSQILANNQTIANQNASWAQQSGEAQSSAQAMKGRAAAGAIVSGEAASGVDVNSGSALDVQASQSELNELDALTIKSNTAKQVYGYQVQAQSAGEQSALESQEASSASTAGDIGAAGSLISGAANAGKFYNQWQLASGSGSPATLS